MAVTVGAFLAATYLVWDARRLDEAPMVEYFRRRAVAAAIVAGAVALVGIFVLRADAEYLFHGLDVTRRCRSSSCRPCAASAALVLLDAGLPQGRTARGHRGGRVDRGGLGGRAVGVHPSREPHRRSGRRALRHHRRGAGRRQCSRSC